MGALRDITPLVPVSDMAEAVTFFCQTLGFGPGLISDGHAYLRRDDVAVRLVPAPPGADMDDPRRQQACYIDVEGLDTLYAALKPALDRLPAGRVRAPFDTDYGQREFHVIHGALLIFFGEALEEDP